MRTRQQSNTTAQLLLGALLIAALMLMQQMWAQPSAGDLIGYPTSDCGKNYWLFDEWHDPEGNQCIAIRGGVSKKDMVDIIKQIVERRKEFDGVNYFHTPYDSALKFFEKWFSTPHP
jgi:hypothetical protein